MLNTPHPFGGFSIIDVNPFQNSSWENYFE